MKLEASPREHPQALPERIRQWARELGFADAGIAHRALDEDETRLRAWLAAGHHGGMAYMARDVGLRCTPERLRPGTVAVISARMACAPDIEQSLTHLANRDAAYISRYALGRDYHRVMRGRLLKLGTRIEQAVGPHGYRVLTDSAPALEKALARNAGLGWIGKNTLLLSRGAGSWFFIGEIYTDLPLPAAAETAAQDGCGRCRACLNVCPTQAFVGPYQLDARRCVSYLTIEHHGSIPDELRPLIGNRIFGCDDCQLVCPWNRHAQRLADAAFAPRGGLESAGLLELFAWSEACWLRATEGMALRRVGYLRWQRNLAVALGNAPASPAALAALRARADHIDPIVREHIDWALRRQEAGVVQSADSGPEN